MTLGVEIAWVIAVLVVAVIAYIVGYKDGQITQDLRQLHGVVDKLEEELREAENAPEND